MKTYINFTLIYIYIYIYIYNTGSDCDNLHEINMPRNLILDKGFIKNWL